MSLLLLAVSAAGMIALGCWRIFVGVIAARPISNRLRIAAGLCGSPTGSDFTGADFPVLERLLAAAGALGGTRRPALWIRAYYAVVRSIARLLPALACWSEREMTVCSRYLAAQVDRFLATNAACSSRVRSL